MFIQIEAYFSSVNSLQEMSLTLASISPQLALNIFSSDCLVLFLLALGVLNLGLQLLESGAY